MAKEQAVLEIVVDENDLLNSAASSKKALLDLKEEQKELNAELKKGTIDADQFAKQTVILEQRIRKESETYKNLTKAINTNANSLDGMRLKLSQLNKERANIDRSNAKQIKDYDRLTKEIQELNAAITKEEQKVGQFSRNVGNYGAKFKEAAQNINVAGVNLGSLTTTMSSFVNPVTAVVGVVGALGAAYARSSIGAKDLAFAQNQLSFATTLVTDKFAALFSSTEDGEGALTKLQDRLIDLFTSEFNIGTLIPRLGLKAIGIDLREIRDQAKALALIEEQLEDLQREEVSLRSEANDRLADNQELMTDLQDEQKDYNEKISITNRMISNIRDSEAAIKANLEAQLAFITAQEEAFPAIEKFTDARLAVEKELSALGKESEKRAQAIQRTEQNLTDEYRKQQEILGFISRRTGRGGDISNVAPGTGSGFLSETGVSAAADLTRFASFAKAEADMTSFQEAESIKRQRARQAELEAEQILNEQRITNTQKLIDTVASIFGEETTAYKALASTQALIDTYRGATAALAPPPVGAGPLFGPLLAAATIAAGLKNVATINGLEFAEGGWTGPGRKHDVAGVVHRDEYVTPKSVVNNPMAGPHLQALERMRTGYADGGFVTSENTLPAQQNMLLLNAIKMMPAPVVSAKEITTVQNRVQVRENAVSLKP